MMEYRGYRAAVKFDDDAGIFHGEVIDTLDVITFQGKPSWSFGKRSLTPSMST